MREELSPVDNFAQFTTLVATIGIELYDEDWIYLYQSWLWSGSAAVATAVLPPYGHQYLENREAIWWFRAHPDPSYELGSYILIAELQIDNPP